MLGNEAEGGKGASLKEFLNADNQKEKTQTEQSCVHSKVGELMDGVVTIKTQEEVLQCHRLSIRSESPIYDYELV